MDDAPNVMRFEVERSRAAQVQPVPAEEGRLRPTDTAARAFALIAQSALAQIAANAAVLREARRLEAVHQLRVGARRLRGALALFGPMLAGEGLDAVKAELKWLTRELNDARNLDVFIAESFRPTARRHRDWPGMAALGKALLAAQTKAYDQAQTAARSARFGVLMLEAAAWVEAGDWTQDADPERVALRARPIGQLAAELLDQSRRKVVKRGRKFASLSPDERHELRLKAKQLRYAAAFFGDLYAGRAAKAHRRFDKAMRALQTALGELTDITTAATLTAEIAGIGEGGGLLDSISQPQVAFAAGLLAAHRNTGEAEAERAAFKAFRRFEEAETFW